MSKIHRVEIRNFMGIAAAEYEIPPAGAVVEGANRRGKTSVLKALRAALVAQGVSKDAIRNGATTAEILVDIDDLSVRRVISEKGSQLTVLRDGARQSSPQAILSGLLGAAPLDPIDLFLSKPEDRKAKILSAVPAPVTLPLLKQWAPLLTEDDLKLAMDGELTGEAAAVLRRVFTDHRHAGDVLPWHGLEVANALGALYYARRTQANKDAAERRKDVSRLLAVAAQAQSAISDQELVAIPLVSAEAAEQLEQEARSGLARILEQEQRAASDGERTGKLRERAAAKRAKASEVRAAAPLAPEPDELLAAQADASNAQGAVDKANAEIREIEAKLETLRGVRDALVSAVYERVDVVQGLEKREAAAHAAMDEIVKLEGEAEEIEALIQEASPTPTEEEVQNARLALRYAELSKKRAAAAIAADKAAQEANKAQELQAETELRRERLDFAVKALANEAPGALLAASGIAGLAVTETGITVNGVSIDRLSGAEQLSFAVDIARRLNAKSKLLIVDGLERLDDDSRAAFLKMATADDYQVIATRVGRGDATLKPIAGETGGEAGEL